MNFDTVPELFSFSFFGVGAFLEAIGLMSKTVLSVCMLYADTATVSSYQDFASLF